MAMQVSVSTALRASDPLRYVAHEDVMIPVHLPPSSGATQVKEYSYMSRSITALAMHAAGA